MTDRPRSRHRPPRRIGSAWAGLALSTWALALLALVVAAPAVASPGAAGAGGGPPRFFIERIDVQTQRLSPEIVLSESLLREGVEYTESDLREAVHRINRLPFVLLAEFSLRKGSERGRYELVIQIFETRRWFFQFGGDWELEDPLGPDLFDPRVDDLPGDRIGDRTDDVFSLVGRRFAVGRRGLLFASFGTEDGAFALGYQHYNLWNRNVLLSVSVGGRDEIGNVLFANDTLTARFQLGIPLKGDHALRLLARRETVDEELLFGQRFDRAETELELAWVFNSLDDPVLPREGSVYEAGAIWSDLEDERVFFLIDGSIRRVDLSDRRVGAFASAGRHWPLAERQSFSAGVRGFFGEGFGGSSVWEAAGNVGHQVFLLRRQELDKWRELRFETQLSALRQSFSDAAADDGFPGAVVDGWQARAGLTYRNGWGIFRLFVSYLDREVR